jgi:hypothetical protein
MEGRPYERVSRDGAEGDGLDDRLSFEGYANLCIRLFA